MGGAEGQGGQDQGVGLAGRVGCRGSYNYRLERPPGN